MPYTPAPTWQHGNYPTAARLNQYKTNLDAIYAITGSAQVNPAIIRRQGTVQGYYLVNLHPWLIYYLEGAASGAHIDDPAGIGESVTLSVTDRWTAHDLGSISWLYPGKLYQVQGVRCCFEDYKDI